jgi:hypothetical protein
MYGLSATPMTLIINRPSGLLYRARGVADFIARYWRHGARSRSVLEPLPVTLAENLFTYNVKPVEVARAKDAACDICQVNPHAGYADCGPSLEFDTDVANALIDRD